MVLMEPLVQRVPRAHKDQLALRVRILRWLDPLVLLVPLGLKDQLDPRVLIVQSLVPLAHKVPLVPQVLKDQPVRIVL
jgi:hypothetical protein